MRFHCCWRPLLHGHVVLDALVAVAVREVSNEVLVGLIDNKMGIIIGLSASTVRAVGPFT